MKGSAGGFTGGTAACEVGRKGIPWGREFIKDGGAAGVLEGPATAYGVETGAGAGAELAAVF